VTSSRTEAGRSRRPLVLGAAAVLCAVLVVVVLLGRADGSRPVGEIELVDLPTHEMVQELANGLGVPYVTELPPLWPTDRHDLRLTRTTERKVLAEIEAIDPRYHADLAGDVIVYWAGTELVPDSPYSHRLGRFQAKGGVAAVVRQLVVEAGLERQLAVQAEQSGQARPVDVDMSDCTVRDVLVEVARQAHLGMRNDPAMIRMGALAE